MLHFEYQNMNKQNINGTKYIPLCIAEESIKGRKVYGKMQIQLMC